jgi:TFIIF-interacting CTD phosphatase-like protein
MKESALGTKEKKVTTNKTRLTVKFRPYLREFLREISKNHEIIVFSSINRKLAEKIVNQIDPEKKYISHLLSEEQCVVIKGV